VQPLFIFSLPRSGSTLLQRILANHEEIATAPEPSVLLPLLYALKPNGSTADYDHATASVALREFLWLTQPSGPDTYLHAVADLTTKLYEAGARDTTYFVDKTPRYHLVVDEIRELFPEARAVFLWRNPLAIAASMLTTFHRGRWRLERSEFDLFDGLARLISAFPRYSERAKALRYEDLVLRPHEAIEDLVTWLGLPYDERLVDQFGEVALPGIMGDRRARVTSAVDTDSLHKWHAEFRNPVRRRWARRYLIWLGAERAATMGYDLGELLAELRGIRGSTEDLGTDFVYATAISTLRGVSRLLPPPLARKALLISMIVQDSLSKSLEQRT
jgi:sulfotransferase family protein